MFSSDATDVFNRIYELDAIKNRVSAEIEAYGKVKDLLKKDLLTDTEENRKTILSLLIQIYFLEGIKFYVSFLVTYIINDSYRNAIPGISKIIKLINYDEDKHVAVIGSLLNILKKDEDEGFKDLFKKK
jgi:ribonucleoside-diphosphate reductase beta chain